MRFTVSLRLFYCLYFCNNVKVDMDDAFGEDLPASALVCKGSNNPMDMDGRLEYINYKV